MPREGFGKGINKLVTLRLSENTVGRDCIGIISSYNSDFTHCILVTTAAMTRCSASLEDRATVH